MIDSLGASAERLSGEVAFIPPAAPRNMSNTLHVFIDEAGDPGFTDRVNIKPYLIFCAIWTYQPRFLSDRLTALRFKLLKDGENLYQFHAADDHAERRDRVIETITAYRDWNFVACVIDKPRVNPLEQPISILYPKYLGIPLRYILREKLKPTTKLIVICQDNLPGKRDHTATVAALKKELARETSPHVRYHLYYHPIVSNAGLQVADYCAYALRRKYEDGNSDYYDRLRQHLDRPEARPLAP